jgi:hypothetical protein
VASVGVSLNSGRQLISCLWHLHCVTVFRCEEHLYKRLRPLVGPTVGPSPMMELRGKLVTSRLLREEEEEEETDYAAIPLRRNSFAPRD